MSRNGWRKWPRTPGYADGYELYANGRAVARIIIRKNSFEVEAYAADGYGVGKQTVETLTEAKRIGLDLAIEQHERLVADLAVLQRLRRKCDA